LNGHFNQRRLRCNRELLAFHWRLLGIRGRQMACQGKTCAILGTESDRKMTMRCYDIVFNGQLMPGAQLGQVQTNLSKLFQADAARIALLFSGRQIVLKSNLEAVAAEKYRATLARAGALVEVRVLAAIEPLEAAAIAIDIATAAEANEVDKSDKASKPIQNGAIEQFAEAKDVEGIEEIELLPPPDAEPVAAVSTGLKVARLKVVPRDAYMAAFAAVDAPDLGIAAVGADLQDARPATPPRAIDLAQFSLAPVGSDMGERKPTAVAAVPNIAHLSLLNP
jgi:hypothetical protein